MIDHDTIIKVFGKTGFTLFQPKLLPILQRAFTCFIQNKAHKQGRTKQQRIAQLTRALA